MREQAILIVDDEAIILLAMKRELKSHFKERFRFETAVDAEEGLRLIGELVGDSVTVSLVISDWLMPGIKGDEFLAAVKARYPGIRTLMVTGHADPDSVARVLRDTNTLKVLRKPWNRNELIEAVTDCVGG